jgi:hypothetical protein
MEEAQTFGGMSKRERVASRALAAQTIKWALELAFFDSKKS